MTYDYDVIVVGGRVAGSSTATLLNGRGHRVLVVERAAMPADTVSTHAIMRTGVLQLTRWGLLDRVRATGAPPVSRIVLGFGGQRVCSDLNEEFGVGELFAPRRHVLDTLMLEAAIESGAHFWPRTRMTGLTRDDRGRVSGIEIEGRAVTARIVVGADGVTSRTATLVDAPMLHRHGPRNASHYAYFRGIDVPAFWFQFTPGINAGIIPTNDDEVLVFVGRPTDLMGQFRADPEREFRRLLRAAGDDLADVVDRGIRVTPFRETVGPAGVPAHAMRSRVGAGRRRRLHEGSHLRSRHQRRVP